jgi:bromodomain adjacent to zinc finger domain protein 1A
MNSRDRLAFSKSILRRFIRDCVDRDAALASPWIVKRSIAERYGVSSVMPDDIKKSVEDVKKTELDKRKKVWEDKDGPPSKKQKKLQEARGKFNTLWFGRRLELRALTAEALSVAAEVRERDQKKEKEKEEAERLAEEKKKQKKKPLRYPTEDLDVRLPEKDIKNGAKLQRPIPRKDTLPFGGDQRVFELFIMTWNFFMAYG